MTNDLQQLHQRLKKLYPAEYEANNYIELTDVLKIEELIRQGECRLLTSKLQELCEKRHGTWVAFQKFSFRLVQLTLEESEFKDVQTKYEDRTKYEALDSSSQRRDILIVNNPKKTDENCVWIRLLKDWNCKVLIFDAKYYTKPLTDKEVYQMYAYLSKDKSRLGIILTSLSEEKNRKKHYTSKTVTALRRIKKDGYGVYIFSREDIKKWIEEFSETGTVQKIFFKKYREFLTDFAP